MYLMKEGNIDNVHVPTYYCESDAEVAQIPSTAPAGTIVEINASTGFKVKMKMANGTWNTLYD